MPVVVAAGDSRRRHITVRIEFVFRKIRSRVHLTKFEFMIAENPNHAPGDHLGPGVVVGRRTPTPRQCSGAEFDDSCAVFPDLRRVARADR
jgi:hypothetical protein